jgi:hypothetical protein
MRTRPPAANREIGLSVRDLENTNPDVWEYTPRGFRLRNRAEGSPELLRQKFLSLGFENYRMQMPDQPGTRMIEEAVRAGRGCVVGLFMPVRGHVSESKHAVVVIELTPTEVRYVDPNDVSRECSMPRKWFDNCWDGFILVLVP